MSQQTEPPVDLDFDLADRMRKSLRASGIRVQAMADYLGVSRNTVGTWINGQIKPGKQTRMLWAMRTGVPLGWLETGELPRLDSNQKPAGYLFSQVSALADAA